MALDAMKNAMAVAVDVTKHGDAKYGENAWDNGKSDAENREDHIKGLGRHLKRYAEGERIDESGYPTLGHIVARAMLALEFEERMKLGRCEDTAGEDEEGEPRQCERYDGHRIIDGTLHRNGTMEWL